MFSLPSPSLLVLGLRLSTFLLVSLALLLSLEAQDKPTTSLNTEDFARGVRESPPNSPAQELASFLLPHGFEVQLVASEPEIAKPLNLAFDTKGRLWVTCTVEYPYPVPIGQAGRDSIKVLEDFDALMVEHAK